MGQKNKERRAAKKRRRQRDASRAAPPRPPSGAHGGQRRDPPPPPVEDLARAVVWSWGVDPGRDQALLDALAARGRPALTAVEGLLAEAVSALWDRGWTPADVVHLTTRRLTASHGDVVAEAAVADGRHRTQRGQALHPRWEAEVAALAGRASSPAALEAALLLAVEVLCLLARLPELPRTLPGPGQALGGSLRDTSRLDGRVLARVRALLAKAESTEFDQEAEALTAKAQELIARHAIDEALLVSPDDVGEPSVRRLLVDDPYADAKASLTAEVAAANRCRTVYTSDLGSVTVFGYEADLDAVELLTASLLAQATGAMARHGSRRDAAGRSRTRAFRRSFLLGFANRIGQRLRVATDGQASSSSAAEQGRFLPVLGAREERLRAAQEAAFPHTVQRVRSVSSTAGWVAGHAAADLADLDVSAGALRR